MNDPNDAAAHLRGADREVTTAIIVDALISLFGVILAVASRDKEIFKDDKFVGRMHALQDDIDALIRQTRASEHGDQR